MRQFSRKIICWYLLRQNWSFDVKICFVGTQFQNFKNIRFHTFSTLKESYIFCLRLVLLLLENNIITIAYSIFPEKLKTGLFLLFQKTYGQCGTFLTAGKKHRFCTLLQKSCYFLKKSENMIKTFFHKKSSSKNIVHIVCFRLLHCMF